VAPCSTFGATVNYVLSLTIVAFLEVAGGTSADVVGTKCDNVCWSCVHWFDYCNTDVVQS